MGYSGKARMTIQVEGSETKKDYSRKTWRYRLLSFGKKFMFSSACDRKAWRGTLTDTFLGAVWVARRQERKPSISKELLELSRKKITAAWSTVRGKGEKSSNQNGMHQQDGAERFDAKKRSNRNDVTPKHLSKWWSSCKTGNTVGKRELGTKKNSVLKISFKRC